MVSPPPRDEQDFCHNHCPISVKVGTHPCASRSGLGQSTELAEAVRVSQLWMVTKMVHSKCPSCTMPLPLPLQSHKSDCNQQMTTRTSRHTSMLNLLAPEWQVPAFPMPSVKLVKGTSKWQDVVLGQTDLPIRLCFRPSTIMRL